jgi:hypothetical protein
MYILQYTSTVNVYLPHTDSCAHLKTTNPALYSRTPCPSPSARIRIVAAIFPVYLSTMLNKYTENLRDTRAGSDCPNSRPFFRSDEKRSDPLNLQYGTVHITRIYHHYSHITLNIPSVYNHCSSIYYPYPQYLLSPPPSLPNFIIPISSINYLYSQYYLWL